MFIRVAVSDPLPVFRHGIMATLGDAGFHSEVPGDLVAWIQNEERRVVVLMTLRSPEDWELLAELRRTSADVIVVALLDEANVATYVRALTAGAAAAVPRDAEPQALRESFEAAVHGKSLVPIDVLHALVSAEPIAAPEADTPTSREVDWLRQLARGATVAELANRAGYSERMMFRLLRDLYTKLRASNRTEALMRARDQGWL